MPKLLRRFPRWVLAVGAVAVLAILLAGGAVLANGAAAAAEPSTWAPILNALVNAAQFLGYLIAGVVTWVARSINSKLKRMEAGFEALIEWQRQWSEATKTNVQKLAVEQKEQAVACLNQHDGPARGRPEVPELVQFEWPPPVFARKAQPGAGDAERTW